MKQHLFFLIFLFATSTVFAQFKAAPGHIDTLDLKNPYAYSTAEKQGGGFYNQAYMESLKVVPDGAAPSKAYNHNVSNALLTATVGAAMGAAGIYGGLKGCNVNRNMFRGGVSMAKASGYYLKEARKIQVEPAADSKESHPSNQ